MTVSHLPTSWGYVNGTPFTAPLPDGKSVNMPASMTLHKPVLHHFTVRHKLGYPSGLRCWCGDELSFSLHEPGQDAKRRSFFDAHDECQPATQDRNA
jgi:hypothetical protein